MKKITATVLAAAMAASMLAPTADAASNTMSTKNYQNHCTLKFNSPGMTQNNGTYTQSAIKNWVSKQDGLKKLADTDLTNAQQSSQLSEAFGSSDAAEHEGRHHYRFRAWHPRPARGTRAAGKAAPLSIVAHPGFDGGESGEVDAVDVLVIGVDHHAVVRGLARLESQGADDARHRGGVGG